MRFLWRLKLRELEEKGYPFTVIILCIIFVLIMICLIVYTSKLSMGVTKLKEFAAESNVVQEMEGTYE